MHVPHGLRGRRHLPGERQLAVPDAHRALRRRWFGHRAEPRTPRRRGFVHVVFCPVGVVADSTTVIALQCALATTFLVKSEFLVTATIPAAPAGVLSKCSPQGLCKTQLSVGRGSFLAAYGVGPSYIVSKVLTFTYRKGS